MSYLEECEDILLALNDDARNWGKHIENFVKCFSNLDKEQIGILRDRIDAKLRFDFMYQVAGNVRREFHNLDDEGKRKILNQFFLLAILENCDFDYRETIIRANSLSEVTKKHSDMKSVEWEKVAHLASGKMKKYLEVYFS